MNLKQSIKEFFNPELKNQRLIDENYGKFEKHIGIIYGSAPHPKELYNLYLKIVEKQRELPSSYAGQNLLEHKKQSIKREFNKDLINLLVKYLHKLLEQNSSAKIYIKAADAICSNYKLILVDYMTELIEDLKEIQGFVDIENLNKKSEFLTKFRKEILYDRSWDWLEAYLKNRDFKEIKTILDKPVVYFIQREEYVKKMLKIIPNLQMQIQKLGKSGYDHYDGSSNQLVELYDSLEKIKYKLVNDYFGSTEVVETIKKLDAHIKLIENGYLQLMNALGQDFAAHGTHVITGEEHARLGMPTGGQGGANFIINNVSEVYGEFGCYIIARCEHLFTEAVRYNAEVKLHFNMNDSIYFLGKELILELSDKSSDRLKSRSQNIYNLEPYLHNRTDIHLQIKKGDHVKLKVPFIIITTSQELEKNKDLQKSHMLIININDNIIENTDNIHNFARMLMQTNKGRAYLNQVLK